MQAVRLDREVAYSYSTTAAEWAGELSPERAVEDFDELIRLDPKFALAYSGRAYAYSRTGRDDLAMKDWDRAIQRDVRDGFAYYHRGLGALAWIAVRQCDQGFRPGPAVGSKHASLYNRGKVYALEERAASARRLKQYGPSIADLTEAIRLEPTRGLNYFYRGFDRYVLKQYDLALEDYNESIRLLPSRSAYFNRGLVRYATGEYEIAILDFARQFGRDPRNARYHRLRGQAWYYLGEYDQAIIALTEAIRLDPNDFEGIFFSRAGIPGAGETARSRADFDQAHRLTRNDLGAYAAGPGSALPRPGWARRDRSAGGSPRSRRRGCATIPGHSRPKGPSPGESRVRGPWSPRAGRDRARSSRLRLSRASGSSTNGSEPAL